MGWGFPGPTDTDSGLTSSPAEDWTTMAPKSVPVALTSPVSSSLDLHAALGKSSEDPPTLQAQLTVTLSHTWPPSMHPLSGQFHRVTLIPHRICFLWPLHLGQNLKSSLISPPPHTFPDTPAPWFNFLNKDQVCVCLFIHLLMHYFKPSAYLLDIGKHLKYFFHWPLSFRSDSSPIPLSFHCQSELSEMDFLKCKQIFPTGCW